MKRPDETIALAYHEALAMIVRVESDLKAVPDPPTYATFLLDGIATAALLAAGIGVKKKYPSDWVKWCDHALRAFLDETVIKHPEKAKLGKWPQADPKAGDTFFVHLDELSRQVRGSPELGEVLSVFVLCMELGFQGTCTRTEIEERIRVTSAKIIICMVMERETEELATPLAAYTGMRRSAPSWGFGTVSTVALVLLLFIYGALSWRLSAKTNETKAHLPGLQARSL